MSLDQGLVTVLGVFLGVLIVWFFWMKKDAGTVLKNSHGYQEALIVVKGGYTPDTLVVESGRPVRLNFRREETAACSEMVLFPDFDKSATLPTGDTVAVEFSPYQAGVYEFACQMGMLRGKLIVQNMDKSTT